MLWSPDRRSRVHRDNLSRNQIIKKHADRREATNAPLVGEEATEGPYASGYPELVEKLLGEKIPLRGRTVFLVLVLGWFGFISWLFIQDNQAGALKDWAGLKWFGAKAGLYTGVVTVVAVIVRIILWLSKSPWQEKKTS